MIGPNTVFQLRPDVRFRVIDSEAVVVRQNEAEVMVLNEVGTRVLKLAAAGCSLQQIAEEIASEFDVDASRAAEDVLTFARELVDSGVVT